MGRMFRFILRLVIFPLLMSQPASAVEFDVRGKIWPLPMVAPSPHAPALRHPLVVKGAKGRDIYKLPVMRKRKAGVLSFIRHIKIKRPLGNGLWLFIEAGKMSNDVYDQYGSKANVIFLYGNKTPNYLSGGKAQIFRANDVLASAFGVTRIPSVVLIKKNDAEIMDWR